MQQLSMTDSAVRNRERRQRFKELGICYHCGTAPVSGRFVCHKCSTRKAKDTNKRRERMKSRRQRRMSQGLCVHCSSPAVLGITVCEKHRLKRAEYNRRHQEKISANQVQLIVPASVVPVVIDFEKPPWFLSFHCETTPTVFEMGVE